jgi:ectoine hydroxylase-related dioxygenase (phytanoyl-CoA dioxygenase family)
LRLNLVNGRCANPNSGLQPLHDLSRRRGRPFEKCNVIWCLDEFTPTNGATRVIPGSHLTGEPFMSRMTDPMLPHPDECLVLAPRGAVIMHNSHLIHGGTMNRSTARRRSLHNAFTTPATPTTYDWRALPTHIREGLQPETLGLLGLR